MENQRSELSVSESDSAEGIRNGALSDDNINSDSDTNREETGVTDDQDQFEEETQKEPDVNRLKSYTNSKLIRAISVVQSVQFDEEKKYFTVNGSKKWYIVTLYPSHCYRIDSPNWQDFFTMRVF